NLRPRGFERARPHSNEAMMRTAVFAVARNEADILPVFLRHILALFDYAILVDHRSIDGSGEMLRAACAGRPGWRCWRAAYEGHHQHQAAAIGLDRLFQDTDADIVCFLDADEFIDVADRTELERLLGTLGDPTQVGQLFWRNCVRANMRQDRLAIGDLILVCPERSMYPKIVVSRAFWHARNGAVRPTAGYHSIEWQQDASVTYQPLGDLLHVPFRSRRQMERKLVLGRLADLARANRAENENVHWRDMLARVAAGAIDEQDLVGWVTGYGEPGFAGRRVDSAGLTALGFSLRPLDVAAVAALHLPPGRELDPLRAMAAVLCEWRLEDGGAGLCLDGDILHLPPPDPPPFDRPAPASTTGEAARHATANEPDADNAPLRHAVAPSEQEAALSTPQKMPASTSFRATTPMRLAAASMRRIRRMLPRRNQGGAR
ncbi:MAG TPA: glycosyltransferase family 2 protein, partial [Acetobacteraceae bacterium]